MSPSRDTIHPGRVDTSGIERLAHEFDQGMPAREFCRLYPAEVAKLRRQVRRVLPHIDLHPVPVNGSAPRGLRAGYFMTRLRDGSRGYLQRRTDDCLQAAIATCLQIPPHQVPDLHMAQLRRQGTRGDGARHSENDGPVGGKARRHDPMPRDTADLGAALDRRR